MHTSLYWFSNDLRLADNPALTHVMSQSEQLAFLYVVDPAWFTSRNYNHRLVGERRYAFILESLLDIEQQLASKGHRLYVVEGDPLVEIPQLVNRNNIDLIGGAKQSGWFESMLWRQLHERLPEHTVVTQWNNYLYPSEPWRSVDTMATDNTAAGTNKLPKPLKSFTSFRHCIEKNAIKPEPDLVGWPADSPASLSLQGDFSSVTELYAKLQSGATAAGKPPITMARFNAGERGGQAHLNDYFNSAAPSTYKQTRNALDDWQASTKFSPYLANGNLSARQIWAAVERYESEVVKNEDTYWIKFELLWREYFHWLAQHQGVSLFQFQGMAKTAPLTSYFSERFKKWCAGNTPYPLVNACMKQLNASGYMSNRGRQLVASCLVNELAVDWRYGAAYFQQQLIDHDVASNWGNWQYLAGVGVDPRGGRSFNLTKQAQIYDPNGDFIRKWEGQISEQSLDSWDAVGWPIEAAAAPK
jgi:deoxyribodipyrimidine photo-lyase